MLQTVCVRLSQAGLTITVNSILPLKTGHSAACTGEDGPAVNGSNGLFPNSTASPASGPDTCAQLEQLRQPETLPHLCRHKQPRIYDAMSAHPVKLPAAFIGHHHGPADHLIHAAAQGPLGLPGLRLRPLLPCCRPAQQKTGVENAATRSLIRG